MVEDEGAPRRFGVHHEAFGRADSDLLGAQEIEKALLVFQARAGGVAEAVACRCGRGRGVVNVQGERPDRGECRPRAARGSQA